MIKKIIIILLFFTFFLWFSFWADGDCWRITALEKENIKNEAIKNSNVIDKKLYEQALINLKKYCNKDTEVLETNIFVNHLMDLAFRKIDAIEGLSYGLELDEKGKAWRDYLNKIEKEYQTPPKNIYNKFIEYWWKPDINMWANPNTLHWKYKLACADIHNMYDIVSSKKTYDWVRLDKNSFYRTCIISTNIRYQEEVDLVEQIMFQNYYKIVNETLFKWFNQIYWKEFIDLYDKFIIALWNYEYLVRRFMKVTDANE